MLYFRNIPTIVKDFFGFYKKKFFLPYESRKFVKNDIIHMKNYQIFIVFLLNDEPGVLKLINFMLFWDNEPDVCLVTLISFVQL